jgi:ketosteroid isomerase-like protein
MILRLMVLRGAAAALALLLMAGAAKPPPPSPESQLLAADRAFAKLAADKGLAAAFFTSMTNDGQFYGDGAAPVNGRGQAFRRLAHREPGTLTRQPETARASADGRMGWTSGRFLLTAPGAKRKTGGHYLTVWTREGRNAWKIAAEMDHSDPAPEK